MSEWFSFSDFGVPIVLLTLGFLAGKWAESRHYRSIRARERKYIHIPVVTTKTLEDKRSIKEAKLVVGSVVISVDYYKRFLAFLRSIFGGEILSYSPLIDRGRREALLRMRESCPDADCFLNCRLETVSISKGRGKATGTVEVMAYSTAITFQK